MKENLPVRRSLKKNSLISDKIFDLKKTRHYYILSFFLCYDNIYYMMIIIGFVVAFVTIGIDQLTKFLIYGKATKVILGDLLWFKSTLNTGVAFSMFEGNSSVFIVITSIASVALIYLILSKKFLYKMRYKVCLGLILGGTIGNLIDRIIFKGVRDFIYLKFLNFAIFNIADAVIVVSVIFFCVFMIIDTFKNDEKKDDKTMDIKEEK